MAKISIPNLKTRFETGDRPTQQDYEDLIDSTSARSTDLASSGIMKTQLQALRMQQ